MSKTYCGHSAKKTADIFFITIQYDSCSPWICTHSHQFWEPNPILWAKKQNQNTQVLNVTEMRRYKVHKAWQGVSRAIVAQWQRQPLTLVSLGIVWSPWPLAGSKCGMCPNNPK